MIALAQGSSPVGRGEEKTLHEECNCKGTLAQGFLHFGERRKLIEWEYETKRGKRDFYLRSIARRAWNQEKEKKKKKKKSYFHLGGSVREGKKKKIFWEGAKRERKKKLNIFLILVKI